VELGCGRRSPAFGSEGRLTGFFSILAFLRIFFKLTREKIFSNLALSVAPVYMV
jgi:hypothetical protein